MREPDSLDDPKSEGGRADRGERVFYGWLIVGVLFFISIIDGGFTYTFSTFLKPLTQEFGWSRAETATAFSLYLFVAGLVLPVWGWLIDHVGARWVFLLSALIRRRRPALAQHSPQPYRLLCLIPVFRCRTGRNRPHARG